MVLIGRSAGQSGNITTAADGTVAIGYQALDDLTSGTGNVVIGYQAGDKITTSSYNTAIGHEALGAEVTGGTGTAVGWKSLGLQNKGDTNNTMNTGVGFQAGYSNVTGTSNTYMGFEAGKGGTGNNSDNVGVGKQALLSVTSGVNNSIIGSAAADAMTTGGDNVAIGKNALGVSQDVDLCVAVGSAAMSQENCTNAADGSIAVGFFSLGSVTSGANNTAVGYKSMHVHTTGSRNTCLGFNTMLDTDAGTSVSSSDNIFIGVSAGGGTWVAESDRNIGIGNYSLDADLNGADYNVCMGYNALTGLTTGIANTAIGYSSSNAIVGGNYNTTLGSSAAGTLTTGSNNTCVGQGSNVSASGASNQQVFGDGATGQGDNYAVIGNASVTRVYGAQDAGATFYGAGQSWSDARIKENVKDIGLGLDFIKKLTPIQFTKKQPKDYEESLKSKISGNLRDIEDTELKRIRPGFIAQDVLEVLEKSGFSSNNSMVQIDEKTTQHSMDYESMVVPLVKAVQELNAKVEELESKLNNKES